MKPGILFLSTLVVLLSSCSSDNNEKNHVSNTEIKQEEAFANDIAENNKASSDNPGNTEQQKGLGIQPDYLTEYQDCNHAQKILTKKGTEISIPANAFIDQKGNVVKGKVAIKFREFQTAGEIIASEIPMTCTDANGNSFNFESAGMFELRAFQSEEELQMAPGKTIQVDLASKETGSYNFYAFNDDDKNWKEKRKNLKEQPNTGKTKRLKEVEEKIKALRTPMAPAAYRPEKGIFDLKINPLLYPELKELNGLVWHNMQETILKKIRQICTTLDRKTGW